MEISEESVLNFIEVTNLSVDDARKFLQEANNNLEVALNNFFLQDQMPPNNDPVVDLTNFTEEEEEEDVREVIPREYHRLVDDDLSSRNVYLSRVKRQFNSSFRDLRKEIEIQEQLATGMAPKRQCLEDIYRNPIDITSNLEFHFAKTYSHRIGKWIAVLINDESFESLSFNRDFFNEPTQRVKKILKENFVFLRKNSSDEEGMRIVQMYNIPQQSVPIFLIIDSLTGELKKNLGDCSKMTLRAMIRELKKYTSVKDKGLVYVSFYVKFKMYLPIFLCF
jgi:UBA-like domain